MNYCDPLPPEIRETLRKIKQEDLLVSLRERRRVKLLY